MKEARLYEKLGDGRVKCFLCPQYCSISPGKRGICAVRENREGVLYTLVYGKVAARNVDPIEKKPLFHFYPGSRSYSIATVGCNFRCMHCQNSGISQYPKEHPDIPGENMTPEQVVQEAERLGCTSISYTYTEPTIFLEFAYECARLAHQRGIRNVFVSNGYTSPDAARLIAPYLDANNIDLKGNDAFYRKIVGAKLQPVLDTIRLMKELGVWVEVTTLIIPDHNDSDEFLTFAAEFLKSVDPAIPWHVTQYYPTFKLIDKPRTPLSTLRRAREIGVKTGLKYVYEGNVPGEGGENTWCPSCRALLIERRGVQLTSLRMRDGKCLQCGAPIDGRGMP
ncbi:MAG: AmmeMemoRadiSam system radical SAM enzyme [Alphaproteobacteria bacterium]|uniref:AmmeMemoRadiSam system radical SAM enzyme n=1 Tax=Candidatus Nitrobium versatile TaxID=2884831 RepID=A0A953M1T7_9BACT|nr:AmmeMemoRadiSam system radical SAM enzyme [Candidatus Nitrobium versatile]